MQKFLSIIVPIFNTEQYLGCCLDSLVQQTNADYEVILVDDGSTDSSVDIAMEFCRRNDRFRLIRKQNGGASEARNVGLSEARGEYVSFVDSDDYVAEDYVAEIVEGLRHTGADILVFGGETFPMDKVANYNLSPYRVTYVDNSIDALLFGRASRPFMCNKAYRRKILIDNNIEFDTNIILGEDQLFQFMAFPYAKIVSFIPNHLYRYRWRRSGSATSLMSDCIDLVMIRHLELVLAIIAWWRERGLLAAWGKELLEWAICFIWEYLEKGSHNLAIECGRRFLDAIEASSEVSLGSKAADCLRKIEELVLCDAMSPMVSIVIPAYNAEKFFQECLTSLEIQTFRRFEVIIVDDGSTDATVEIAGECCARDARFRLLRQEHGFAGRARNLAMKQARGDYLLFLDADDYFDKNLLEDAVARAVAFDADVCVFAARSYDHEAHQIRDMPWTCRSEIVPQDIAFSRRIESEMLYCFTTAAPWTKLFKRSFIEEHGLSFQSTRSANDLLFVFMALSLAERIVTLPETLLTYRINAGGSLQSTQDKDPFAFYEALKALKESLLAKGIYEDLERPFVNFALDYCVYNLGTMKTREAFYLVYDLLKKEGFDYLDIRGRPENCFYMYKNRNFEKKQVIEHQSADFYMQKFGIALV